MPRAAKSKKATAAKATAAKPRNAKKAAAKKKPAAPAPRKRVTFKPASGETLKENATQLEVAERMLAELAYDLTVPTSYNFLARLRKAAGVADDAKVRAAACGVCVGEGSARALAFVFGNPSPA